MKCPYTIHRKIISQIAFEYNTDSNVTIQTETINNVAIMVDCVQKDCGAWQNGKCCYNACFTSE